MKLQKGKKEITPIFFVCAIEISMNEKETIIYQENSRI